MNGSNMNAGIPRITPRTLTQMGRISSYFHAQRNPLAGNCTVVSRHEDSRRMEGSSSQMQIASALRALNWRVTQVWRYGRNTKVRRKEEPTRSSQLGRILSTSIPTSK